MKRRNKRNKNVIIIWLIVLLLGLAVGYAAFSDTLEISGTASANGTFNLEFQNAEVVKAVGVNEEGTTAVISDDRNTLQVNVANLSYPGAGVEFSVDIVNVGSIPAKVNAVHPTNLTGSEHIKIEGLEAITTNHEVIPAGDKCNLHFTVVWPESATTALGTEGEKTSFGLEIEYTQATTGIFDGKPSHDNEVDESDISVVQTNQKLVDTIQGSDYGKTINYSAIVKGKAVSNWKVFLNDGENVYIILDDYLENRLLPAEIELQTTNKYGVYSSTDRDTLLNSLVTTNNWSEFANGVVGATAKGSLTMSQFVDSWNENPEVNSKRINSEATYDSGELSDTTGLYLPHTKEVEGCIGYWLDRTQSENSEHIYNVRYFGGINSTKYDDERFAVRPIVCLPSNITGTVGETVEID